MPAPRGLGNGKCGPLATQRHASGAGVNHNRAKLVKLHRRDVSAVVKSAPLSPHESAAPTESPHPPTPRRGRGRHYLPPIMAVTPWSTACSAIFNDVVKLSAPSSSPGGRWQCRSITGRAPQKPIHGRSLDAHQIWHEHGLFCLQLRQRPVFQADRPHVRTRASARSEERCSGSNPR
jgi:hypothetical protein